jgi:hypothetical protein
MSRLLLCATFRFHLDGLFQLAMCFVRERVSVPLPQVSVCTPCGEKPVEFYVNLSAETQQIVIAHETFARAFPLVPVDFHRYVWAITSKFPS